MRIQVVQIRLGYFGWHRGRPHDLKSAIPQHHDIWLSAIYRDRRMSASGKSMALAALKVRDISPEPFGFRCCPLSSPGLRRIYSCQPKQIYSSNLGLVPNVTRLIGSRFSLAQRKPALRGFCGKITCCWRRNRNPEFGASAFLVRLFAFAAVRERSWPVSGSSGRWLRGEIRRSHHMARVIEASQAQGHV